MTFFILPLVILSVGQVSTARTLIVDDDGPGDHTTIMSAVGEAEDGDLIIVNNGSYNESLFIDERLTLTGNGTDRPVITIESGIALTIAGDRVNVSGFDVRTEDNGILVRGSNCSISNMTVRCSPVGISLYYSENNTLKDISMIDCGLRIDGVDTECWNTHDIDVSNTVNGRPIRYLVNVSDHTVPDDTGQVITVQCERIELSGLNISNVPDGIMVALSNDNRIVNNQISSCTYGITLLASHRNYIATNRIDSNYQGIAIGAHHRNYYGECRENVILANDCIENDWGIRIYRSNLNRISYNNCSSNGQGIELVDSVGNDVLGNNCYWNRLWGIEVYNSQENDVIDNTCLYNDIGIKLEYVDDMTSEDNVCTDNRVGSTIGYADNCVVQDNDFSNNSKRGIEMERSYTNRIARNDCSGNGDNGIYLLRADRNVIRNNDCSDTGSWGIHLVSSDGNHIYGNSGSKYDDRIEEGLLLVTRVLMMLITSVLLLAWVAVRDRTGEPKIVRWVLDILVTIFAVTLGTSGFLFLIGMEWEAFVVFAALAFMGIIYMIFIPWCDLKRPRVLFGSPLKKWGAMLAGTIIFGLAGLYHVESFSGPDHEIPLYVKVLEPISQMVLISSTFMLMGVLISLQGYLQKKEQKRTIVSRPRGMGRSEAIKTQKNMNIVSMGTFIGLIILYHGLSLYSIFGPNPVVLAMNAIGVLLIAFAVWTYHRNRYDIRRLARARKRRIERSRYLNKASPWLSVGLLGVAFLLFIIAFLDTVSLAHRNPEDGPWVVNAFVGTEGFTDAFFICFPISLAAIIVPLILLAKGGKRFRNTATTMVYNALLWNLVLLLLSQMKAVAFKPAIYLRTPKVDKETVRLYLKGRTIRTIPERPLSSITEWRDLTLEDGRIHSDGAMHDYLIYEAETIVPRVSDRGWTIGKGTVGYTWNGDPVSVGDLRTIFSDIMDGYGFLENEVNDFIDYWIAEDMKIAFGKDEFNYAVQPALEADIERIFKLETELVYEEYLRVMFVVREVPPDTMLSEPEIRPIERSDHSLHEWGVILSEAQR